MKSLHEIQQGFRILNRELIEEYEHEVKLFKEEDKKMSKQRAENATQQRKILEDAGFNIKLIEKIQKENTEAFQKNLQPRRQEFINRKSQLSSELQLRQFYSELVNESHNKILQPFGACVMAADQKLVENIKGEERGNPWVYPDNPSPIEIKDFGNADVWCFQAYGGIPPPVANIWFHFVPNVTGLWNFSAAVAFNGFYILRSDDGYFSCKKAWVKLTASVRVYQYSWQAKKTYTLLDKSEQNADYIRFYDSTDWLDTSALLRAGDTAWILVKITVEGMSRGSGAYGELNFQDGAGNFILPALVIANPA